MLSDLRYDVKACCDVRTFYFNFNPVRKASHLLSIAGFNIYIFIGRVQYFHNKLEREMTHACLYKIFMAMFSILESFSRAFQLTSAMCQLINGAKLLVSCAHPEVIPHITTFASTGCKVYGYSLKEPLKVRGD